MRADVGRHRVVPAPRRAAAARALLAASLLVLAATARGGAITPDLERALAARGTHADTAILVRFTDPVDPTPYAPADRRARDNRLLLALKANAVRARETVVPALNAAGARRVQDLWIVNGLAATVPAHTVRGLAALPGVARIDVDSFVQTGRSQRLPPPRARGAADTLAPQAESAEAAPLDTAALLRATPEWNITAVHAPALWARGVAGRGVVVATMDTGADLGHPDLRRTWRGGANSWFDPYGEEPMPYDAVGHGTQALGVIVAGGARGIAPDARWIAVRLYDANGRARMSDIHRAFQWLMDPDGDPATLDAPDVVNASWTLAGRRPGSCIDEFAADIGALRASGIAVVFAAGNDGPGPGTSNSPANNPGAIAVGAVDRDRTLARQSSTGPSGCDGGVFPHLVAPGLGVRSADLAHGGPAAYATVSGTSLAAPHVTGVLALLMSAFPGAPLDALEAALARSAARPGTPGAEARFGHGFVDAEAAFALLRSARDGWAIGPIKGQVDGLSPAGPGE